MEHDIFASKSKRFYLAFPEDDTNIDITEICTFYEKLEKQGSTNQMIAGTASDDFSWENIMQPVYEKLKGESY